MTDISSWQYDEFQQAGTDYNDPAEVEAYDSRHAQFRDVDAECRAILDALDLARESVLIEFGAGTGAFAIRAAGRCAKVHAIDTSQLMLDCAARKAEDAHAANISFHHAGFLTYEHQCRAADAVVTFMAFHHLPDFWKGIALGRMNRMLGMDGQLYIQDVVFTDKDAAVNVSRWVDCMAGIGGEKLRREIEDHIRQEYSTYDWIMEGLLARAGFAIKDKQIAHGVIGTYHCITTGSKVY